MASVAQHLFRRTDGTYYLRCRIPVDLVPIIGRRELRRSLATADPRQAKIKVTRLYIRLQVAFERIRKAA